MEYDEMIKMKAGVVNKSYFRYKPLDREFKNLIKCYASNDSTTVYCEKLFNVIKQVIEVNTESCEITHYEDVTWENVFKYNYANSFVENIEYNCLFFRNFHWLAEWILVENIDIYGLYTMEYIIYVAKYYQENSKSILLRYNEFIKTLE